MSVTTVMPIARAAVAEDDFEDLDLRVLETTGMPLGQMMCSTGDGCGSSCCSSACSSRASDPFEF